MESCVKAVVSRFEQKQGVKFMEDIEQVNLFARTKRMHTAYLSWMEHGVDGAGQEGREIVIGALTTSTEPASSHGMYATLHGYRTSL